MENLDELYTLLFYIKKPAGSREGGGGAGLPGGGSLPTVPTVPDCRQ